MTRPVTHPPTPTPTPTPERIADADIRAAGSFAEFYPLYLREHSDRRCRWLHFAGSTLVIVCLLMLLATGRLPYLLYALLCGYGFAWIGHFGFEKNKPASFKRPLYSLMGDWAMYRDMWLGRVRF